MCVCVYAYVYACVHIYEYSVHVIVQKQYARMRAQRVYMRVRVRAQERIHYDTCYYIIDACIYTGHLLITYASHYCIIGDVTFSGTPTVYTVYTV